MNSDREWLREMAEKEDGCIVSTGGMVTDTLNFEGMTPQQAAELILHGGDGCDRAWWIEQITAAIKHFSKEDR